MRNLFIALIVLAGAAAAVGYVFRVEIGAAVFQRVVSQVVGRNVTATLPDGLHVALCGSGSPMPDATRMGPCTAVIAGKRLFVVDVGSGAARNFGPMGLPTGAVEAVLLTHFHSDHIDGLGEMMMLRWAGGGNAAPLPVYGPSGVEAVIAGFNAAYVADDGYRVAHHGADINPPSGAGGEARPFSIDPAVQSVVVFENDGLKVTAFTVDHAPIEPAVGYRFDYKGRSVVISGDTKPSENLVRVATGADLLVHEALNREMVETIGAALAQSGNKRAAKIFNDILNYHTSPVEAAQIAKRAGVKALVLTHIVPAVPVAYLNALFLKGTGAAFDGPITMGEDGMIFSLPANSAEINNGRLK
ncbi:MAG: MBL fold metallo-hydrolase [Alphaproteobacteria bacterium]|nr:MBL fold metallo-hydrolase [Alphaproteobacteria bacterium]